ncbi:MAG: hypothetical protein FWF73_01660 [Spirochaetes bacterium]|nr:hypothetical protein [Spirochaetota bacterium]
MKKRLLNIIYISLIIIIPRKVFAIDITAGASAWYAWGSRYENVQKESIRKNNNYAFDPTLFYGPALSVKINSDFNLTFVYLYSKFNYTENVYEDEGGKYFVDSKIKRSDSDFALNYRFHDYFKVFAGAKYMSYKIKLSYDDIYRGHCDSQSEHYSLGPGLGLSATIPITENIFLLATFSGFYLYSNGEKFKDNKLYDDRYPKPVNVTVGYNEYGINSNVSAAYYIPKISTVISLGFRFQYFITDYDNYEPFLINSIKNQIYGVTLTATYTFGL